MKQHNIGVVGTWDNMNYGSQLTYYALYRYLINEGYNVFLIQGTTNEIKGKLSPSLFRKNPYPTNILIKTNIAYMNELNKKCDTFIVGSDQLWRDDFFLKTKDVNLLFFAHEDKRKISYATSFGKTSFKSSDKVVRRMKHLLSRFDKISVREKTGINICKDIFSVQAEVTLDPVFLCKKEEFEGLISYSKKILSDDSFIFVYILHPSKEKKTRIKTIINNSTKKIVFVRSPRKNLDYEECEFPYESDCKVEDWLFYIKNCSLVITDSFHAFCFSVLYNKKIIPIFQTLNGKDSGERILSLAEIFKINISLQQMNKTMENDDKVSYFNLAEIDKISLEKEINRSKDWLKNALMIQVNNDKTDLLLEDLRKEIQELLFLKKEIEKTEMGHRQEKNRLKFGDRNIILFGAGKNLEKEFEHIRNSINISGIVDNDTKKWGLVFDGIECKCPRYINEIANPYVIITAKNEAVIREIKSYLHSANITDIALLSEWL